MAISKIILFLLLSSPLIGSDNRVLYYIQSGRLAEGLTLYEEYKKDRGEHDVELVKQIGYILLEQGANHSDPEIHLLSLFGAGIATDDHTLYIMEKALRDGNPRDQIVALNFISKYSNQYELIKPALASDHLLIRLEAVYQLANKQHPKASFHIESLMQKVPPAALPVFPQLLALAGDKSAISMLRRLMNNPNLEVRLQSVLSAAKNNRDDLLSDIRKFSFHLKPEEQEAASIALGFMKDEQSAERLIEISHSTIQPVADAAHFALYQLGREEHAEALSESAAKGDLFAINLLGEIPGSEDLLGQIVNNNDRNIRFNAGLALLELRDRRCVPALLEILINDPRDLSLTKIYSPGGGLNAWKVVPSSKQNLKSNPTASEVYLSTREKILTKAVELPEEDFLLLASRLFEIRHKDLIPLLVRLLESTGTENSEKLLRYKREQIGDPFTRCWCNLALYRMGKGEPFAPSLKEWVENNHNRGLIELRPYVPLNWKEKERTVYHLTPEEASRLLVESLEALLQHRDDDSLDLLLHAIKNGKLKNRYALAGLLIRASN